MPSHTSPTPRSPRRTTTKTSKRAQPTNATAERRSEVVTAAIDPEQRRALIAQAAYFRAERRHFAPGYEHQDWLDAEAEVDTVLTMGPPSDN